MRAVEALETQDGTTASLLMNDHEGREKDDENERQRRLAAMLCSRNALLTSRGVRGRAPAISAGDRRHSTLNPLQPMGTLARGTGTRACLVGRRGVERVPPPRASALLSRERVAGTRGACVAVVHHCAAALPTGNCAGCCEHGGKLEASLLGKENAAAVDWGRHIYLHVTHATQEEILNTYYLCWGFLGPRRLLSAASQ